VSHAKPDCRHLNPDAKRVIRLAGYLTTRFLGLPVLVPPGNGYMSLVNVVFRQVEVSATTDHSSRVVLPSVVCLGVISKSPH
jgi:hypothetical protein